MTAVPRRPSVLLTTEGTYPYHGGGVSTWCHALTRQLHDIPFTIFGVAMHPYLNRRYELAPNVTGVVMVPLWGTADPAESRPGLSYPAFLERRAAAATDHARVSFERAWCKFLDSVLAPGGPALAGLTSAVVALHAHFAKHDYRAAFADARVWSSFVARAAAAWRSEHRGWTPALAELTEAYQLAYRFLIVLDANIPPCDIVHSTAAGLCGLPGIIAKVTRGTPYLLTEHGLYLREQYLNLRRTTVSMFVRWFAVRLFGAIADLNYHHADLIAPVCEYNTRWERWRGVRESRIRVIYNGVDPARFPPLPPARNVRPTVVSMAQIFALKGQMDLIDAAGIVRRDLPDVEFRLYGAITDESYYRQCRARVEALRLQSTICFSGATDQPGEAYRQADIVALASVSEGFPFTVIEAMLSRRAVVATDIGGVSEAVGDAGLLVHPRSPADLAHAITSLLGSDERRDRLAGLGCDRATTLFTEDRFIQAYADSYQSLFASRARDVAGHPAA